MIRKNKKGQEEIVGFVLIMVIIVVVMLIFLGISIRKGSSESSLDNSVEVYQFLESSMEHTTECAFNSAPDYYNLGELIRECDENGSCSDGKKACLVLENSLKDMLDISWNISPESDIKGYEFNSVYSSSSENTGERNIVSVKEGNCTGANRGASYLIPSFPGKIENTLIVCS